MTHRFSAHDPAQGHDTAGVPWAGRTLTGTGFDDDTGAADARLAELLGRSAERLDEQELVAAVSDARLIVPIVAVPGEIDTSSGIPVDASSDMASVTLVAPDGQRALPAFTSTRALVDWNAQARPVPVTAQRAALAAVQEGCDVIPLDLGVPPGPPAFTLRPSMVWALASGRPWVAAHDDEHVAAAVRRSIADEPQITGLGLSGGEQGELRINLAVTAGLTHDDLQGLLTRVGERLAADGETRARIDALAFRISEAT